MAGALERAGAGGAGTPVGFTVSITRLTSAGLRQEHYSIVDSFTARGAKPIMAFSVLCLT